MNRKEAEALVGKPVKVWTAANGEYVGTLESVHGRPWRGVVRITGILLVAQHFERGAVCRRGFRVGETIEAGNSSIRPTGVAGSESYLQVVDETIALYEARKQHTSDRNLWVWEAFVKALNQVAIAEKRRLETGLWSLKP